MNFGSELKLGAMALGFLGVSACQDGRKLGAVIPERPVSGSFVVEVSSDVGEMEKASLEESLQAIAMEEGCKELTMEELLWESSEQALPSSLTSSYHVLMGGCPKDDGLTESLLDKLLALENIRSAEAEAVMSTQLVENDTYLDRQYYHDSINRNEACDLSSNAKPVVVAVIDSGVQKNHPDLVDRFYRDQSGRVIGANFVGKGARLSPDSNWGDGQGHGTHVAGLVAASANNGQGISGVGACKNVLIMPVRVMGNQGTGSSVEIDRGIQWAAAKGADIINLSLGSTSFARRKQQSHPKSLYSSLGNQGVIVFAAAGNDGFRNGSSSGRGYMYSYPASYDNVIAVGATNSRDQLTDFSVYGDHIDIAAPGQDTISTYPGSAYKLMSGTSMATPIAAGAYALALSSARQKGNEVLYHDELNEVLMDSVSGGSFTNQDIASGGVIDTSALTAMLLDRFPASSGEGDEQLPVTPPSEGEDSGAEEDQGGESEEPETTPAEPSEDGLLLGLRNGQSVGSEGIKIRIGNIPEGASRVYLYWITGYEWFPRSFTYLDGRDLIAGRAELESSSQYILYGKKYLVAEVVDVYGQRIASESVQLNGL